MEIAIILLLLTVWLLWVVFQPTHTSPSVIAQSQMENPSPGDRSTVHARLETTSTRPDAQRHDGRTNDGFGTSFFYSVATGIAIGLNPAGLILAAMMPHQKSDHRSRHTR